MPLTLGLTGMDPATESALTDTLNAANARLGGRWQLVPDQEADYVIVDMDSMYGPMSWLRLHADQKQVVGLTTAARTQADFRLERPFDADNVAALLTELAKAAGIPLTAAEPEPASAPEPPSGVASTTPPIAASLKAPAESSPPASPPPVSPPPPATPAAAVSTGTSSGLAAWLAKGRLNGRVRLQRNGLDVLIDTDTRQYLAGATLKPLAPLFEDALTAADFKPVDDATWTTRAGKTEPQPLARLVWLGGLLGSPGRIAAGHDPDGHFHMLKWPRTEREYPKHFRIATVMMKGPATLAGIATASGVDEAEVADFINANLATGFAAAYHEPEPEPESPRSGLFSRLRGR